MSSSISVSSAVKVVPKADACKAGKLAQLREYSWVLNNKGGSHELETFDLRLAEVGSYIPPEFVRGRCRHRG